METIATQPKRRRFWPAVCLALILFAPQASAETVDYVARDAPLFRFDVPDGWAWRDGYAAPSGATPGGAPPGPRIISVRPPGEGQVMWTGLWSPDGVADLEAARIYLGRVIPRELETPEITYRDARKVNGRPAYVFSGNAMRNGRGFDFVFAVVQVAPDRVAVVAFIGEPGIFDRNETALRDMLNSVRPIGSEGR